MSNRKFSLVTKIMAIFNLGEEGKLHSFFEQIEKKANLDIKKLEQNIKKAELDHEITMQSLNDNIEDAKQALDNAYVDIEIDELETNISQKRYMETYLRNIKDKEQRVESLEQEKKNTIEAFEESVEDFKKSIATIKSRLEKILAEESAE